MSKRYWGIAGLCLALATNPVFGQQDAGGVRSESSSIEERRSAQSENPKSLPFPVVVLETDDQAQHAADREANSDKHEADDLKAQQDAATAAGRAAASAERQEISTWTQVGFGFVGTLLLVYSLYVNTRATGAAVEAAKAAREALAADRAWVVIKGFTCGVVKDGLWNCTPVKDSFGFNYIYENTGHSPAIGLTQQFEIYLIPWDQKLMPHVPPVDFGPIAGAVVGPGMPINSQMYPLTDEEAEGFRTRKLKVVLYGRVRYFDVFTKNIAHVTEVCGDVEYQGQRTDPDGTVHLNTIWSPRGPQNTVS
ncbi:MAG: hypothetical protein ABL879_06155 [Devosia sp.]